MKKNILQNKLGMTLIEALMAVSIFAMGIAGFSLLFSKTWQINAYTLEMGQSSMAVSQGLNKMVDYIRRSRQGDDGSYPVQVAKDDEMTIFCDYNKDSTTERLHFYKSGQNILMGITVPTATLPKTYPVGDQTVITVASHIVNASTAHVFQYFNKNYPLDVTNNPLSTPASVADIRMARIYLEININPAHAPDNIHVQSFVEMRNLNDYNQAQ